MAQLADSECWSTGIVFNLSCPRARPFIASLLSKATVSRPSQKARHQMLFIWRIRSIFPAVPPITHSCSLSLKRMVLVNWPTKIASLLPHISPMHPKAMLSKMGISMMYAAQRTRNIGSVVLSLLSRTHTCCASESFVVLSVRPSICDIYPTLLHPDGGRREGSRSNPFRSARSGGSLRVSPEPSSFPGSRRNLPACPSR